MLKILGIIILTLILVTGGIYLYVTDFGRRGILSTEPRRPKIEMPITYNVGWWAYQNDLTIDDFDVEIVESKLNLFNSKSLISYKIKGQIKYKGHWKPSIKEVHISERLNNDTTQNFDRIIELTPVVGVKNDEKLKGGIEEFEFTNEQMITSGNWGLNRLKFICGDKEKIIGLRQSK